MASITVLKFFSQIFKNDSHQLEFNNWVNLQFLICFAYLYCVILKMSCKCQVLHIDVYIMQTYCKYTLDSPHDEQRSSDQGPVNFSVFIQNYIKINSRIWFGQILVLYYLTNVLCVTWTIYTQNIVLFYMPTLLLHWKSKYYYTSRLTHNKAKSPWQVINLSLV